jgi:hypothetical protein
MYAHDIFGNTLNGCEGWVDWNMVLNQQGGPNVSSNWCSAGIIANTGSSALTFNPLYYYMVQFSKYCRPGAVRIGTSVSGSGALEVMAFKNTDGSMVVIAHNTGNSSYTARVISGSNQIEYTSTALSLETFMWNPTTEVIANAAPQKRQLPATIRRIVGLDGKYDQQNVGAARYTVTGKRISTAHSTQAHGTSGVYVEKPAVRTGN